MKTHLKQLLFAGLIAAFFSCDTEENLPVIEQVDGIPESNSIDPRFIEYLDRVGFGQVEESNIIESEDNYVVEGDMVFSKTEIASYYDEMDKLKGQNLQRRYSIVVSTPPFEFTTFKYKFNTSIPSSIRTSVNEAFDKWNQIRNYRIKFEEVTTGSYNTFITTGPDPGAYADAFLPTGTGVVGNTMRIDVSEFNSISHSQRVFIAAHEIGHLVGLRHTDSSASPEHILIPGTFQPDPQSVMNSGGFFYPIVPNWTAFSYLDLLAIRTLYPHDTGEVPLYVYLNTGTGGFNWTTNWNTYQYGALGHSYYGLNGYIFTYAFPTTVPLYKYKHSTFHITYMSTDPNLNISTPAWVNQGQLGYVFTSPASNRMAIYEWYHPDKGYHFTTLTEENDGIVQSGGWTGGGIAFYTVTLEYN